MHHYALPGWPSPSPSYTLNASEFFKKSIAIAALDLYLIRLCVLYTIFEKKGKSWNNASRFPTPKSMHEYEFHVLFDFYITTGNEWEFFISLGMLYESTRAFAKERDQKRLMNYQVWNLLLKKNVWSIRSNGMWWKVEHYNPMWAYSKKRELCGVKILIYLWDCVALEKGAQQ